MINTISFTVMNLLHTVLLNKTSFTASITRILGFWSIFGLENLVYLEAINSGILFQHSNILETTSCTVMNFLLIVLLHETRFTASKPRFLAFSIDFWTRNLVYLSATNSGIMVQYSNIINTISCTVMNFLFTVLLNKTGFTASKT